MLKIRPRESRNFIKPSVARSHPGIFILLLPEKQIKRLLFIHQDPFNSISSRTRLQKRQRSHATVAKDPSKVSQWPFATLDPPGSFETNEWIKATTALKFLKT